MLGRCRAFSRFRFARLVAFSSFGIESGRGPAESDGLAWMRRRQLAANEMWREAASPSDLSPLACDASPSGHKWAATPWPALLIGTRDEKA